MPRRAPLLLTLFALLIFPAAGHAATSATVSNPTPIAIAEVGNASPYPSAIAVSGLDGEVVTVTATLTGVTHEAASEISALLVAPSGKSVLLMGARCSGIPSPGATFTFSDEAQDFLPTAGQPCPSGTYKPAGGANQTAPLGSSGRGGQLSLFTGEKPNGPWKLFVSDSRRYTGGGISGGWSLSITSRVSSTVAMCKKKKKRSKKKKTRKCAKKKKGTKKGSKK